VRVIALRQIKIEQVELGYLKIFLDKLGRLSRAIKVFYLC